MFTFWAVNRVFKFDISVLVSHENSLGVLKFQFDIPVLVFQLNSLGVLQFQFEISLCWCLQKVSFNFKLISLILSVGVSRKLTRCITISIWYPCVSVSLISLIPYVGVWRNLTRCLLPAPLLRASQHQTLGTAKNFINHFC